MTTQSIVLTRTVRITLPWQFPTVDLPAGTVATVTPADNIPQPNTYWLAHDSVEHDYGVLVLTHEFEVA